jgi:type IV pilus assembly protein PilY1
MMVKTSTQARPTFRAFHAAGLLAAAIALFAGQHLAKAQVTTESALAQTPLFVSQGYPPLNMLVMGRDHKMYYEAYNDASDLDGDGVIDVGYKPDKIDYYGYFNNNACYSYSGDKFTPVAAATGTKNKQCDGTKWSGDFLNYLTTSRMDAMRRVLYGGTRAPNEDTASGTVLQGSYIPRDAHSWGKAYDPTRDLSIYDIRKYTPLAQPVAGTRHLFAVTTTAESDDGAIPRLRVLNDSKFQIWEWVSKEQPVAQDKCIDNGTSCEQGASSNFEMLPSSSFQKLSISTWKSTGNTPRNGAEMDAYFTTNARPGNLCGTGALSVINTQGPNNNPFVPGANSCTQDRYITRITGEILIPAGGSYTFAVDGDDAVDATIDGNTWGWYDNHGGDRSQGGLQSHSKEITFSSAGWKTVTFRQVENAGDDHWGLAVKNTRPASAITDYKVRVDACTSSNAALREDTCKPYQNDAGTIVYKPTGLLHDFGENEKMYFGLLTGSYQKNIAGGTLRRNVSKFTSEVNPKTGQFITPADGKGIVANIDGQKAIGFNGSTYNNCGWITDGPISGKSDPSICAMWGNPMAEMMFETLRYFAGATAGHATYDYGNGSSKDKDLGLSKPDWKPPYSSSTGGGGYLQCARPVMTVLSDINPSYDSKIPGSRYNSIAINAADLGAFDVSSEVDAIGAAEGIHGKKFFIGQSTSGNADAAPTVKTVDALSWVRGLSPQEPSKEGTYYAAGVSRYAANNFLFGNAKGKNRLMTYSVAIASPLPEIRFPVGDGRFVTIAPYAKSVTGSGIDNTKFAPTNQIVDYYVDRIANTGAANSDATVNGGRPYAEFRINYEDVEQGADHDMDAISRYTVALQADNTVKIDMVSEYAAGGIGQHQGYVISGTTKDGMYLDVRDKDTASVFYALNTPQGRDPGYCVGRSTDSECINLGLTSSRVFTPSATSTAGTFLKDPLWYAAKYGMPGRDPSTVKGDPDNYFLVTNATTLKAQMTKAFNDIVQNTNSVTAVSVDVPGGTITAGADLYRTRFEAEGWVGDVIRERLTENTTGLNYVRTWSAAEMLSNRTTARKIYYSAAGVATPTLREFSWANINGQPTDVAWKTALNINPATNTPDGKAEQRVAFLRGENDTLRVRKKLTSGKSNILGDIVNSSPVRVNGALYRASAADGLEGSGSNYSGFVTGQAGKPEMIYVGANDGMLHAFRAGTGEEEFAFVPTAVRANLNLLTASNYGVKDGIEHRYYVDGTPTVSDVYFGGEWHKVLVGSLGAGGRAVFAMDITDPTAPKLLWEFGSGQDNNMGNSVAQPTIARLNDPSSGKGKWVALVPNGYQGGNSLAGTGGASLFVIDISNGSVLRRLDVDAGATAAELGTLGNGLSRISAVDGNGDGKADMAYAGDLMGNVWRFDMRSGDITAWTVQKLFTAKDADGVRQPITAAPYVIGHPLGRGDLVMFGTGRLLTATDKSSTQKQTVYGIWDRYSEFNSVAPSPLPTTNKTRSNLQAQTFTELVAGSGNYGISKTNMQWYKTTATGTTDTDVDKWGWYVDLPRNGEKMTYDMTLYGKGLFFSTIRTSEDPCSAGLSGTLYGIDPNSGGQTNYVVFDMNGDGAFNASDAVGGGTVSGTQTGAGKQTIRAGRVFDPSANAEKRVNSGVEFGRQSWRRQPPN